MAGIRARLTALVVALAAVCGSSARGQAPTPVTTTYAVANSLDDVNQVGSALAEFGTTIWVGTGGSASSSYTGLRFLLDIPRGSVVTTARLEVNASQTQWLSIGFELGIEDSGNAAPFSTSAPPSGRSLTARRVAHSSNAQWLAGSWYSLGEVSQLVQDVVNRQDWTSASAAAFVMRGTVGTWGRKFAHSSDGQPALAPRLIVTYTPSDSSPPPPPPPPSSGFSNNQILSGLNAPTSMVFTPDGRMLVTERAGRVRVALPGRTGYEAAPFLQLSNIESIVGERALINLALDPSFATTGHYYAFYTRATPLRDVVSRFTAVGNSTDLSTEVVLYQDPLTSSDIHHGGGLIVGGDGRLYISTGDGRDASPGASHVSQLLTSGRGKVLRINTDGSIPEDNPFNDGTGPNVDAIWARGFRNPFRLSVDAATGAIHVFDVGGGAFEEIDTLVPGANYGWPICEGACGTAGMTNPLFAYSHVGRDAAIGGGVVYRGSMFPAAYQGNLFYGDFVQSWIRRLVLSGPDTVSVDLPFEPPDGAADGPTGNVVDIDVGPDGALYYVNIGAGAVHRISYFSGNRPPQITDVTATPTSGSGTPFPVQFTVNATDPDAQGLTYSWEFGDGTTSTVEDPEHIYQATGAFVARVLVSDGELTTYSTTLTITVGSPPTATILSPEDGAPFVAGEQIAFEGQADDPDQALTDAAFSWTVVFRHDTHPHPGFGPFTGVRSGAFTVPTTGHDFSGDTRYEIVLTVTDAQGLTSTVQRTIRPAKVDVTLASDPPGLQVSLDELTQAAPLTRDTLTGFTHRVTTTTPQQLGGTTYQFVGWSDGGGAAHDIVAPASHQTLVATFRPVVGVSVSDATATEGTGVLGSAVFVVSLSAPSTQPVTVQYATTAGSAAAGLDFTTTSGSITIPAGQTSAPIAVAIAPDALYEAPETFTLVLTSPVNASIADGTGLATIVDDDPPPVLSVGDITVVEGHSGSTPASFTVALSSPSGLPVSVNYATAAGTATAGDFTAASGTLTIPAGSGSGAIAVSVTGDIALEPAETFVVNLSTPVNASIGDGQGVATITNDDTSGPITVTYTLSSGANDVNEVGTAFAGTATTLWIGTGGSASASYAGFRFPVSIPRGAAIVSARLEVQSSKVQWLSIGYEVGIENSGASRAFSTTARPSTRVLTPRRLPHASNTQWSANTWYSLGEVGPLLQDVVNRADWTTTSAATFVLRGTVGTWGRKFLWTVEGQPTAAPRLIVTYQ